MNILLIGSGGREHAFATKLSESPLCSNLFVLPGNAGTKNIATNIPLEVTDFVNIGKFCLDNDIQLVVVGPEEPLVKGLRDYFFADDRLKLIGFVGPDASGARLEGSKNFSKKFMVKYQIPTAAYATFTIDNLPQGVEYLKNHTLPVVLKADGLAAGKGVLICNDTQEAIQAFDEMLHGKFGSAGNNVVVEEFLQGIECSVFVLTDGESYKVLPIAKDYKRIGEGDRGLNTGGMGAVSPVPFADDAFVEKVKNKIIEPTIKGLKNESINYVGFIFIGLMKVGDEPYVIEYNCRMGDPETEAVLPLIETDFVALLNATARAQLKNIELILSKKHAVTIMLVSKGYPEDYEKGKVITGIDEVKGSYIFHAGTKFSDKNELLSNGGRVMAITTLSDSLEGGLKLSLENAEKINFENKYYRKDIGYEFS